MGNGGAWGSRGGREFLGAGGVEGQKIGDRSGVRCAASCNAVVAARKETHQNISGLLGLLLIGVRAKNRRLPKDIEGVLFLFLFRY